MSNKKILFGVALNDSPTPVLVDRKPLPSYSKWYGMIKRCYSKNELSRCPTYIGCSVCDDWLLFSNFEKWFNDHYVEGWQLDKDLIIKGNKVYSPNTCVFVPAKVNSLVLDSRKTRGEYPIGVSYHKHTGKFQARVSAWPKSVYLGVFDTVDKAHIAYTIAKHKMIDDMKDELDSIDVRLYTSIKSMYPFDQNQQITKTKG